MAVKTIPEFKTTFAADDPRLFHFELKIDGEPLTLNLKPLRQMPMGVLRRSHAAAKNGDEEERLWLMLKWGAVAEGDEEIVDRLPGEAFELVMESWQEHGEMSLGESSKSPSSSANGDSAKPSKSTSSSRD